MRARIAQRPNFFGECRAEFPDPGARTVVFIPSHLFHPLHLCSRVPQEIRRSPEPRGFRPVLRSAMNDAAETAAARLWRDRAQIREHERDEAGAHAQIARKWRS